MWIASRAGLTRLFPCPSLSGRLLQPQVMPSSRRHRRRFRGVQMCLALCLLALLLYPQVSPPPPSFSFLWASLGQLTEPAPNTIRAPVSGSHLWLIRSREAAVLVVEHKAVGTDATWKMPDSGLFEK